jgi:hypothetical protein
VEETNAIYRILKKIRERKEQLQHVIANGIHSWDMYNKSVGEYKAYNIMEQEVQDLQKDDDRDTGT